MSLYDPSGCSEDGVIVLLTGVEESDDDVFVKEWEHGGIVIQQENDMICLNVDQVEELYSILKHNL